MGRGWRRGEVEGWGEGGGGVRWRDGERVEEG
jgi:hypothetical protein